MHYLALQVKMEVLGTEVEKKPFSSNKPCASPSSGVPVPDAHSITATSTATPAAGGPTLYNPEIELSTDTDDSSSDMAAEPGNNFNILHFIFCAPVSQYTIVLYKH